MYTFVYKKGSRSQVMLSEFRKFMMRGNVLDLAVGIIIGAAFSSIVNSLVSDIIMPPLGFALNRVDLSNMYLNLSGGEYDSLGAARNAGAVTINYGLFLNALINFLIVAFAVFLIVRGVNRLVEASKKDKDGEPTNRDCPHCLSTVPFKATVCAHCTRDLPPPTPDDEKIAKEQEKEDEVKAPPPINPTTPLTTTTPSIPPTSDQAASTTPPRAQ